MLSIILLLLSPLVMESQGVSPDTEAWPSGTYGLPKSSSGCPRTWDEGWLKQDMENDHPYKSNFSVGLHMEATITNNDIKRYFCMKTKDDGKNKQWPSGSYCIYKKAQCPSGMRSGSIEWDDEDDLRTVNEKSGTLPYGNYGSSSTVIYYCCQDQGQWSYPIELPVDQPFYLLPYNSANCQRVKWAISSLEFITYDTENAHNLDNFQGRHVFTKKVDGLPTIYYCYYEGCRHIVNGDSGNFSVTNYPDYQYCSWLISVKTSLIVFLHFTALNVPGCDKNYIEIYDGANDTAPLLVKLCGSNATSGRKVLAAGSNIYMLLKSDDNSQIKGNRLGFNVSYKTLTRDITQKNSWPSGSYGLPKPSSGCPTMWNEGWRKQDLENDRRQISNHSRSFHMDVVLTDDYIKRTFCTRTIILQGQNNIWPKGSYCIYKKSHCPPGMQSGSIKWDDEDDSPTVNDKGGTLPDGDYRWSSTKIDYCCQDQGRWYNAIELPVEKPFYLLPYNSKNCQRVKWAVSSLEYITYDTEDTGNIDSFHGHHVYSNELDSLPTLYYCYFTGCQHKLLGDEGYFSSIVFPDYQYCSWKITVEESLVVLLSFTSLSVPDCDKNHMDVYDGANDTTPLLAKYCGSNATAGNTVRAKGHEIYLVLKSGYNPTSSGRQLSFHAKYKAVDQGTPIVWPSGTYGLPKASSGCPKDWVQGWRKQDMENDQHQSSLSANFHMDAKLTNDYINRTFCMKTSPDKAHSPWPKGLYCIYKRSHCPPGMQSGSISWDDEDDSPTVNDRGGTLPDGDYRSSSTQIYYCCQDQGQWYNAIDLPVERPFYLLPYNSANCQRVKWLVSTLEYITYDTEDYDNHDKFENSHVFTNGVKSFPKIYYCYYTGIPQTEMTAGTPTTTLSSSGSSSPYTTLSSYNTLSSSGSTSTGFIKISSATAITAITSVIVPTMTIPTTNGEQSWSKETPRVEITAGITTTSLSLSGSTSAGFKKSFPATAITRTTPEIKATMALYTTEEPGNGEMGRSADDQGKSSLIIAIILPVLAVLIIAFGILFYWRRTYRKKQKREPGPNVQNPAYGTTRISAGLQDAIVRYEAPSEIAVECNGACVISRESDNPVYEPGDYPNAEPIYCSIDDGVIESAYEKPFVQGNPAAHYDDLRVSTTGPHDISQREGNNYDIPVIPARQKP